MKYSFDNNNNNDDFKNRVFLLLFITLNGISTGNLVKTGHEIINGNNSQDYIIGALLWLATTVYTAQRAFQIYKEIYKDKNNNKSQINDMKKRLIMSFVFWIPLISIAMSNMFYKWVQINNALIFVIVQVVLLIPIIILNKNYFIVGFKRLIKRTPNMDSLIAIGSTASIIYGFFAIYMISYGLIKNEFELVEIYSKDIYLESAGTILTLITLGKYLETKSKGKTSEAISKLINLAPKTVTVIKENQEIDVTFETI